MALVKEDIVFGLVANKRAEVFADYAVPISAVFLIKLFLDVLRHEVLNFEVVDRVFGLG